MYGHYIPQMSSGSPEEIPSYIRSWEFENFTKIHKFLWKLTKAVLYVIYRQPAIANLRFFQFQAPNDANPAFEKLWM